LSKWWVRVACLDWQTGINALHRGSPYGSPALWQQSSQWCPSHAYQVNSRTGSKCPSLGQSLWKSCAVATFFPMVSITCLPGEQPGINALQRGSSYGSPALWQHPTQWCPSHAYQVNSRTGTNALHRGSPYGSPALWQHPSQWCPSHAYQVNSRTGIKCPTQGQFLWRYFLSTITHRK
jgi:hypothetical protein